MRRSATTITKRTFSTSQPSQLARMTLVGRLGTDPEVQQSANGTSFVKYAVGTSYGPKENRQTSWFRVANFSAEGSPQRDYVMGLGKGYVSNSHTALKSWLVLSEVGKEGPCRALTCVV